jgi:hypothetical protein
VKCENTSQHLQSEFWYVCSGWLEYSELYVRTHEDYHEEGEFHEPDSNWDTPVFILILVQGLDFLTFLPYQTTVLGC